ncbi:protogenin [Acomys russatus]|uniref:protogenin n=1 Tax=Acomys russatus TaxID=60746 RepID=UPI0021E1C902|nr:protogenin [Acomys russatus]
MAPPVRPGMPPLLLWLLLPSLGSVPGVWSFSELFFLKEPQDVTVTRKDSVVLDCQAHGEGPIKVTWLKNGAKLSENKRIQVLSNGSLYISEVEGRRGEQSDEGFYQCLAVNKYGAVLSQKAHLTLSTISAFEVHPVSTEVQEGGVARFSCKISSNPPAVITWEFNRTALPMAMDRNDEAKCYKGLKLSTSQIKSTVRKHTATENPRRKYHVRLLAYNSMEDGYQADQTVSTPGCVSVRDRMVPPPPPPHHLYAKANTSSSILLLWRRPAFTTAQAINYTIRCNPVGLQNASLVLYLQTSETHMLVQGLEPNTKYEFAVRLHVDQLSSPWSPVLYHTTLPEAPTGPPVGVKVTLIEDDTALVSWKPPDGPETVVTRYTILYASRKAWIAGEWQVLHREGAITMALLENLVAGNVYIIKISASNEVGEGPFSNSVELAVLPKDTSELNQRPKRLDSSNAKVHSGYYHLDQRSMTGIAVGAGIALTCILVCALILICRSKARKSSASKTAQNGAQPLSRASGSVAAGSDLGKSLERAAENEESLVPMMPSSFIDAKGGTDLIINSYGPIIKNSTKKKWLFFQDTKKIKVEQTQRRFAQAVCFYQPGTTVLISDEDSPSSPGQTTSFARPFGATLDTEHSANSEGSHETGDSGRFSHESTDEIHVSSVISSTPPISNPLTSGDSDGTAALKKLGDAAEPSAAEQTSSAPRPPSAGLCFAVGGFPV